MSRNAFPDCEETYNRNEELVREEEPMKYRVYWKGEHPKPKRQFHDGVFEKRQQARQWCRNHSWLPGLTVVHPGGVEEPYNAPHEGPGSPLKFPVGFAVGAVHYKRGYRGGIVYRNEF